MLLCKEHLGLAQPQAVVANSGIANAATGAQGLHDARATAAEAAQALGLEPEQVLVLSTGVIGATLPLDNVLAGVRAAAGSLAADGGQAAAEAILTTDTFAKQAVAHGAGFTVGGMAKGSGMIHPNLATMLAVVTTDYPLEPGEAFAFLRPAVNASFNAISVDGECSTNDTVLLLANGASGIERTPATDEEFALCLAHGLRRAREADRRRRRRRDRARRDRGARRRERRRGARDRRARRDVAARQDRAVRPRRELGPHRRRRRLGEVRRRLRRPRPRQADDRDRRRAGPRRRPPVRRRAGARRTATARSRSGSRSATARRATSRPTSRTTTCASTRSTGRDRRAQGRRRIDERRHGRGRPSCARSATRSASCTAPARRSPRRWSGAGSRCASSTACA